MLWHKVQKTSMAGCSDIYISIASCVKRKNPGLYKRDYKSNSNLSKNIWSFRKKHIKSKSKTYQTCLYSLVVYAGLQIWLRHVKTYMSFWNKNITTFKIQNISPLIQCSCICRLTNRTPNTCIYTVVVYVTYKQITKFLHIQYGCISSLLTNYQIPTYTMWLYMWPISGCQIPTYILHLYKQLIGAQNFK